MVHSMRLFPKMVDPEYWRRLWVEIKLVGHLMKDGRVPLYTKAIPFLVGIYLLSPFDLVPDIIPVLGQMDDFGLLVISLSAFIRLAPPEVVDDYMPRDMALKAQINQ
ncbi:MAG: hypothetical protein CL608_30285 [Anaerolineaceae bacterium]|nr:hypothetical protein [Anaerolineaceae bacterium]